jgi:hypothetical protein
MSEATIQTQSTGFKIGWWILFSISVLGAVGHAALVFALPGEEVLFIGWAALNLYSVLVLYFPYRRGEKWAWYTTWVMIVPFALVMLFDAQIGSMYLILAGLMAVGQLLARRQFFAGEHSAR